MPPNGNLQVVTPGGLELFSGIVQNLATVPINLNIQTDGGTAPAVALGPGAYVRFTNVCLIQVQNDVACTLNVLGIIQVYQNVDDYNDACKRSTLSLENSSYTTGTAVVRATFLDRNAKTVGTSGTVLLIPPQPKTLVASYTVPTNRKALIMYGKAEISRTAASATFSTDSIFAQTMSNSALLVIASINEPTMYAKDVDNISQSTMIPASDGVQIYYYFQSAGGYIWAWAQVTVCEFDQ
jgi:hypothetical protein